MFQFTTTNVVNSPWWNGYSADFSEFDSSNVDDPHALFTAETGHFYVKGVNDFLAENVVSVYKAKSRPAVLASLKFNFNPVGDQIIDEDDKLKKGDVFRINIYIGLSQGSNDAMYSNDYYFKGKPLMIEFTYTGKWDTTLAKLEKTIKRLNLTSEGEKMVDVEVNADDKTITLTAINEYQRFMKYAVEKLDRTAYNGVGDWVEVAEPEDYITVTEGQEGFGTYNWILHNLRIPTAARNDMFGQNFEETPVVGGMYDQYTIHYCKNRGSLGLNAVGDQTMSHTTHVFYVLNTGCDGSISDQFQVAMEEAFGASFQPQDIDDINTFAEGYEKPLKLVPGIKEANEDDASGEPGDGI